MASNGTSGYPGVFVKWSGLIMQWFARSSGNVIAQLDPANRQLTIPSGSTLNIASGATFTQAGTRTASGGLVDKVALGHADTAGGVLAWQAPVDCFVREILIDVTTKSTGACTLDVGPAANGTTLNDTMLDGIDVGTATGVFSSRDATNGADTAAYTDAILTFKRSAAGAWFTASKASGSAAGLVGNAYIVYMPI